MDPHDTPAKRLDAALRGIRELTARRRNGEITAEEFRATAGALLRDARLDQPNLSRPWWADDLSWLLRSLAQSVHSRVLREGEHVKLLARLDTNLRPTDIDGCQLLAVDLEAAVADMTKFGFELSLPDAARAIAIAADQHPGLVHQTGYRARFELPPERRRVLLLDWAQVQALGASPRRGDPRGL